MKIAIMKSVGENARNIESDVKKIQLALNNFIKSNELKPLDLLYNDGIAGRKTKYAIREFQRKIVGMSYPDGRVDPNGKTIRHLESKWSDEKSVVPIKSIQISYNPAYSMIFGTKRQFNFPPINKPTMPMEYPAGANMELRALSKEAFVYKVHEGAKIEEEKSSVPAGITTAQAILETGYGKHVPSDIDTGKYSFNLFGIKGVGPAGSVSIYTHEVINNQRIKIIDKFRAYHSFAESISGRTHFFKTNRRYAPLFESTDAEKWAHGLKQCGYATDPKYPEKLISIMKSWNLI